MEIEKGNLEILLQKIPYTYITVKCIDLKNCHDYSKINRNLYMQHSRSVFQNNTEDERYNNYLLLKQSMQKNAGHKPNIFRVIMDIADKMLTYDGEEIRCKFDELLRWREISFQLGQDLFTCAFLAGEDLKRGCASEYFAWLPIIRSDDDRLHNILKRGMSENHFHLAGSTKIFELNWMSLMNIIDGRRHDFKKIDKALQSHYLDRIKEDENRESFYAECQRAALYRVYLFLLLKKEVYLKERAEIIQEKIMQGHSLETFSAEIQDIIVLCKNKYGAKTDGKNILDYALQKDMIDANDNECRLLAGERRFLYECFRASVTDQFNNLQKNLFYVYLSIRTHFRGEMIQINRQAGFANFKHYQDRKEIFIEGEEAYEDELIRLALNESLRKENILSLEARICPKARASKLYKSIRRNEKILEGAEDEKLREKLSFVLHFPKIADGDFCPGSPRNYNARALALRQAKSVAALLEHGTALNQIVRGIDTCSSEMNCRPEVYGQIYRYLSDIVFSCPEQSLQDTRHRSRKLHTTYHAGEDFLDLVDGIRAVDEAVLFCGLTRGSRIGHGLSLGICPDQYSKRKAERFSLPKQVLIDNIAWLLCRCAEMGCVIESQLKAELEERFYNLYEEIYGGNVHEECQVTILDYYHSWKLRGDDPQLYRLEEKEYLKRLEWKEGESLRISRYRFNNLVTDSVRKVRKYRDLYFAYHYNENVRKAGDQRTEFKVDQRYADIVYQIQNKMIYQLVRKGIAIETNPSSNYLIGTIHKYDEHPILRFNSRKLKRSESNMSLSVSINTDDQGVFDTLLENEYALMALALKKAKGDKHQLLYDVEDIYEWIDYVRKMGIEQRFL